VRDICGTSRSPGTAPHSNRLSGVDDLKAPPVNPRTNSSSVVLGADHTAGANTDGWIWNDTTKTLYAQFFDEAAASDGDPATNAWTGP